MMAKFNWNPKVGEVCWAWGPYWFDPGEIIKPWYSNWSPDDPLPNPCMWKHRGHARMSFSANGRDTDYLVKFRRTGRDTFELLEKYPWPGYDCGVDLDDGVTLVAPGVVLVESN